MADDLKPKSEWELAPNAISQARREAARKALDNRAPYYRGEADLSKPFGTNLRTGEYMRTMEPLIDEEGEFTATGRPLTGSAVTAVSNVLDRGSHGDVRPEMIQEMGKRTAIDTEAERHKRLLEHKMRSSEPGARRTQLDDYRNRAPQARADTQRDLMEDALSGEKQHYQDEIDYLKRFYGTK